MLLAQKFHLKDTRIYVHFLSFLKKKKKKLNTSGPPSVGRGSLHQISRQWVQQERNRCRMCTADKMTCLEAINTTCHTNPSENHMIYTILLTCWWRQTKDQCLLWVLKMKDCPKFQDNSVTPLGYNVPLKSYLLNYPIPPLCVDLLPPCPTMPVCHRTSTGINETPHLVTVKWPHVEDAVRWETVCLYPACLFDPAPLRKMINHALFLLL